jgi:AAA+ ATPase superfamily predicted ATPase
MSFDPNTGLPSIGFSMNRMPGNLEVSLNAIGEFLKSNKSKVLIAIDEFQQISHYPEKLIKFFGVIAPSAFSNIAWH